MLFLVILIILLLIIGGLVYCFVALCRERKLNKFIKLWPFVVMLIPLVFFLCILYRDAKTVPLNTSKELTKYEKEKAQVEIALDEQISPTTREILEHYNDYLDEKIPNLKNQLEIQKSGYWPFYHQSH